MLDVDDSLRGYGDPLAGYLDLKSPALFDTVGQTPQLRDELLRGIVFLNVT